MTSILIARLATELEMASLYLRAAEKIITQLQEES